MMDKYLLAQAMYAAGDDARDIRRKLKITRRDWKEKVIDALHGDVPGKPIILYSPASVWATRSMGGGAE